MNIHKFINENAHHQKNLQKAFSQKVFGYTNNYLVFDDKNLVSEIVDAYKTAGKKLTIQKVGLSQINDEVSEVEEGSTLIYVHLKDKEIGNLGIQHSSPVNGVTFISLDAKIDSILSELESSTSSSYVVLMALNHDELSGEELMDYSTDSLTVDLSRQEDTDLDDEEDEDLLDERMLAGLDSETNADQVFTVTSVGFEGYMLMLSFAIITYLGSMFMVAIEVPEVISRFPYIVGREN